MHAPTRPSVEGLMALHGMSREACDLYLSSDVIDLHVESYSFYRSFGYDPRKRHGRSLHRALLVGQADLPRLQEAGIHGATWVISANPLRPPEDRKDAFRSMVGELRALLESADVPARVVRTRGEFRAAQAAGAHAAFLGVQGANAFPPDPSCLDEFRSALVRITLMHLTDSAWGRTSTPLPRRNGRWLGGIGAAFVEKMNDLGIAVDLAHIHEQGFWEVVRVHKKEIPFVVTHTGVRGAFDHWRNLSDAQLRAVADSGGTVGIMYHSAYLGDPLLDGKLSSVVRHILHALSIVGPDHVSLGSDWDGAICTPRDMPTCLELPRLVQALLDAGVGPEAIQKLLGENFLRVVDAVGGPS